ncbi:CCNC isoform 15, partial [Pan troglodytes]
MAGNFWQSSHYPKRRDHFALLKSLEQSWSFLSGKGNECGRQDNSGKTNEKIMKGHCLSLQWILDKQDLLKERQKDLKFLSEEEYWKLQIFFTNVIQALGEHLKLRQQVIATATVYFKRFYARYSLKSIDPVLMAPTCVFLASKVEEFGVVSNTRLIAAATSVLKTRFSYAFPKEFPYRMNHILECEFYLLEL